MDMLENCGCLADFRQYPEKEVEDFRQQLLAIQDEVHFENDPHEGKTAEEVYVERLAMIQICETCQQPPEVVVKSLLARCLLWVEIIEQKYVSHLRSGGAYH